MRPIHLKSAIDSELANYYYNRFKDEIKWEDSIKSKRMNCVTRKGKNATVEYIECLHELLSGVSPIIMNVLAKTKYEKLEILDCYLNYYVDGLHWCPSHSHPGMTQIVISLGCIRKLTIATKTYDVSNGDIIIFGGSNHSILRDESIKDGRISVALFCKME